jgi:hypothetical protein
LDNNDILNSNKFDKKSVIKVVVKSKDTYREEYLRVNSINEENKEINFSLI